MDARKELRSKKKLLRSKIDEFMKNTDFDRGKILIREIRKSAEEITALKKEIYGAKQAPYIFSLFFAKFTIHVMKRKLMEK